MADADLDDLLFAYASGSLDEAARRRVEAILDADPAARQQLRWYEAVCDGFVEALPAPRSLPTAQVIVEAARAARPHRSDAAPQGFLAWLTGPALRPAVALGALLVIAQAAVIVGLLVERDAEQVRALAPSVKGAVVFVVAFDPDATEADIRELLLKAEATIIDGPRQLGDYRVAVPANRAEYARGLFEESGIAEYVRQEESRR